MSTKVEVPCLMAATPVMLDPFFRESVVLLISHDSEGAFGFVVNNVTEMALRELIIGLDIDENVQVPVWIAGPVESETGIVLHNGSAEGNDTELQPGAVLSASTDTLRDLIDHERANALGIRSESTGAVPGLRYPYRLLVGYSGWAAGQLDQEMRQGAWVRAPISDEVLFNTDNHLMWAKTLASIGVSHTSAMVSQASDWLN